MIKQLIFLALMVAFDNTNAQILNSSRLEKMGLNKDMKEITVKSYSTIEIDPDTFKEYTKLSSVTFYLYNLTKLDLKVFRNSPYLASLCLITPKLTQLTNTDKLTFSKLTTLEMDLDNSLRNLDQDVLNSAPNLTKLSFDFSYELSPLKPNQLASMKKLLYLKLYTRNQHNLTKAHFNGLTSLVYLRFLSSNIQRIDNDTFSSLSNLAYLELTNNSLTSIDGLQFPSKLSSLLVNQNMISGLRTTKSMENIRYLDLSSNRFRSFSSVDFNILSNLTKLLISDNPIGNQSEIGNYLRPLVNLDDIRLNNLSIRSFDSSLFRFNPKLDEIELANNNITVFDSKSFAGLYKLTQVNLGGNRIGRIGPNSFSNLSIALLNLTNNLLTELDDSTFVGQKNLTYIDLSRNLLAKIGAKTFNDMVSLKVVYFSNNRLTQLDSSMFKGCDNLKYIYLYNNTNLPIHTMETLCPNSKCKVYY